MRIDYYYAIISGYAYLGEARLQRLAAAAGAEIAYRPVDIGKVFAACETTPPAKYSPVKLAWRQTDTARWAKRAGLPIKLVPRHWPVPPELPSRAVIAAGATAQGAGPLSSALLRAIWAEDRNIAERETILAAAETAGYDPSIIARGLEDPGTRAAYEANTAAAIAAGVVGSPTYVIEGDMFFGQDRLDFAAERLGLPRAAAG